MSLGGLTGAGSGSIAGSTATPAWPAAAPKADGGVLVSHARGGSLSPDGPKPGGGKDTGVETLSEEQSRKLQAFDAVKGRPSGFDSPGDVGLAQASVGTMTDAAPDMVGDGPGSSRIRLEDAGQTEGGALQTMGKIAKKGARKAGGAVAGVVLPTNGNLDQTLAIPGHPQYRITGKEDMVGRSLEVQNADGGWEPIGEVSVSGDQSGTTVDMAEVNDVLKDRGFEPIGLMPTSLPGTPIDGPRGPGILSTPDHGPRGADIVSTPTEGSLGADVLSTPIPKEQDAQILEAVWSDGKPGSGARNALGHWNKHKADYPGMDNALDYTRRAVELRDQPPPGALTKTRPNRDFVRYDPATNDFAAYKSDGTPKTLFKPADGMKYFQRQ